MPIISVGFFAATFCAMWPCLARRATYSFWIAALAVYFLGGIFAIIARIIVISVHRG